MTTTTDARRESRRDARAAHQGQQIEPPYRQADDRGRTDRTALAQASRHLPVRGVRNPSSAPPGLSPRSLACRALVSYAVIVR